MGEVLPGIKHLAARFWDVDNYGKLVEVLQVGADASNKYVERLWPYVSTPAGDEINAAYVEFYDWSAEAEGPLRFKFRSISGLITHNRHTGVTTLGAPIPAAATTEGVLGVELVFDSKRNTFQPAIPVFHPDSSVQLNIGFVKPAFGGSKYEGNQRYELYDKEWQLVESLEQLHGQQIPTEIYPGFVSLSGVRTPLIERIVRVSGLKSLPIFTRPNGRPYAYGFSETEVKKRQFPYSVLSGEVSFASTSGTTTGQIRWTSGAQPAVVEFKAGVPFHTTVIPDIDNEEVILSDDQERAHQPRDLRSTLYWYVWLRPLPPTLFAEVWNSAVATPYFGALRNVADAADVSFVPRLESLDLSADSGRSFEALFDAVQSVDAAKSVFEHRLASLRPMDGEAVFKAVATFPGLVARDGAPITREVDVRVERSDFVKSLEWFDVAPEPDREVAFTVRVTSVEPSNGAAFSAGASGDAKQVRLGALDLTVSGKAVEGRIDLKIKVRFEAANGGDAYGSAERDLKGIGNRKRIPFAGEAIPRVEVTINRFDLWDVGPGSQDPLPDAARAFSAILDPTVVDDDDDATKREDKIKENLTREPPLVFVDPGPAKNPGDLEPDSNDAKPRFFLTGREETKRDSNRRLRLNLRQNSRPGSSEAKRTIVVDPEPFTVALVDVPEFDSGDIADSDGEIGNWELSETEGSRWELAGATNGFDLFFPPQVTGEEAEKGKPWDAVGIENGQAVTLNYRFGTLARLKLSSSFFKQRYAEATWNLRRILGYAGQRAPGASLRTARTELLYGLAARFTAPSLRLAETSSRLGALRDPLLATPRHISRASDAPDEQKARARVYDAYRLDWSGYAKAFGTRLGVFEVYRDGQDGPISIEDRVAFNLRAEARKTEGPLKEFEPWNPNGDFIGFLRGGALWGIESKNIYDEIVEKPTSVDGHIFEPKFSAIGGSGSLRAFFANRKSRLIAETGLGRTHTYTVERIGRIACFWNVAKHVIVYRRTVLPSEQFVDAQQNENDGRPILRKFEEYVEIIQPDREYPEQGSSLKSRGFVEACRFRTIRIPVNGRWGRDVSGGWVIPLWQRDASQQLYPKPDVRLDLTAAAADSAAALSSRFKDPSELTFYTSTNSGDSDNTDKWGAKIGIDFVNIPPPQPVGEPSIDPADPDGPAAEDIAEDPLLRPVTFQIEPDGQQANIITGRAPADPIGAVLENVTMMRASSSGSDGGNVGVAVNLQKELERIVADLATLRGTLDGALDTARNVIASGLDLIEKSAEEIKDFVEREIVRLEGVRDVVRREAGRAREAIKEACARARVLVGGISGWGDSATTVKSEYVAELGSAIENRIKQLDDAIVAFDRVLGEFSGAFGGKPALRRQFRDWLQPVELAISSRLAVVEHALDDADNLLADLTSHNAFAEEIRQDIEAAKKRVDEILTQNERSDARKEVENVLAKILALLSKLDDSLRRKKPKQLDGIAGALSDAVTKGKKIVTTIRDESLPKMTGTLAEIKSAATTALTEFETWRQERVNELDSLIQSVSDLIKAARKEYSDTVEAVLAGVTSATGRLVDAIVESSQYDLEYLVATIRYCLTGAGAEPIDPPTPLPTPLRVALGSVRTGVGEYIERTAEAVDKVVDSFNATIDDISGSAKMAITDADNIAKTSVDKLENYAVEAIDTLIAQLRSSSGTLADALSEAAKVVTDQAEAVADAIDDAIPGSLRDTARDIEQGYKRLTAAPTFQDPSSTIALVRAAGSPPRLPNLDFNVRSMVCYFDAAKDAIKTSPAVALMNRVDDDLKALGIRLPTNEIVDQLIPSGLDKIDFSSIFPDLSGLKLDGLFKNLRLPLNKDNVKVTHGFDKASLTGWAKATAFSNLPARSDIFALGPLKLAALNSRFSASADLSVGVDGKTTRSAKGEIVGDWELAFGGQALVTLEQTRLFFEDGSGIDIDIDPRKVKLDRAIKFLSDLIKSYSEPGSGFFLELIPEGGVAARLQLPMPPLSFGAFSVWGLSFNAAFELHLTPSSGGKGNFAIGTKLALGSKIQPFILRVWILVGGGWLETEAKYFPRTGAVDSRVSLGLTAGLGLDFAFGPCRGYVFAMLGAYAEFESKGGGSQLSIAVIFLVRGGIVILGRFNIGLYLLLELIYREDGSLIGRGTIEVTFKICWCLKITVRQSVTYHLTGGSSSQAMNALAANASPAARRRAMRSDEKRHYLDSFA